MLQQRILASLILLVGIRWSASWSSYCKYNSQVMMKSSPFLLHSKCSNPMKSYSSSYRNDRFSFSNSGHKAFLSSVGEKEVLSTSISSNIRYFVRKWTSILSSRSFISATLALIAMAISSCFPKRAFAATATDSLSRTGAGILNPNGWDLFGRVPFDDFLFSTWQLTEPNLLRRTMQEAIAFELPISLANYRRSKMLSDLLGIAKGCGLMMLAIYILGFIIQRARLEIQKDREREAAIRGFFMPISALYKGKERVEGQELEGMDGWIDMRRDVKKDDDNDDDDDDDSEPAGEDGDAKKGGDNDSTKDKDKGKGKKK